MRPMPDLNHFSIRNQKPTVTTDPPRHPRFSEAERLAASVDLRRLHMAKGIDAPVPSAEEALAYRYSPEERAYVGQQRARLVQGDPGEVREKLLALKEKFEADELMVITITGDPESRRTSYRLVVEAFE